MDFLAPPQHRQPQASATVSHKRDELDDYLSSDLEMSFASTMSLHDRHSAPLTPNGDSSLGAPMDCSPMAIDVSPAPSQLFVKEITKAQTRPRAATHGARMFGRELANVAPAEPSPPSLSGRKLNRPGLPTEWISSNSITHVRAQSETVPGTPSDCGMDVDASFHLEPVSPGPLSAAPTIKAFADLSSPAPASSAPQFQDLSSPPSAVPVAGSFHNLFYDTTSPRRSLDSPDGRHLPQQIKKRRSDSPSFVERSRNAARMALTGNSSNELDPSSPAASSPMQRKLERMASNPLLNRFAAAAAAVPAPDLGSPLNLAGAKRLRRPALSAINPPVDAATHAKTAMSIPTSASLNGPPSRLPARRAFSAMVQPPPGMFGEDCSSPGDENSTFADASFGSVGGPDTESPAQAYAQRQQVRTIRRRDGTEDFRSRTGATAMISRETEGSPAKFMSPGLPGFGDNEAHGKILPCHRVKEDGLMRINPQTLTDLVDGRYGAQIADFHIIDCRFDYEYNGGHVPGAININTTSGVEDFFFGNGILRPKPCTSADGARKTVLVFHCEFSAKRAPTFAKHLRSKDRSMNNHCYPKIHYPEVYVLEGGYCQYFKEQSSRCEPRGYIRMDDPVHAQSRREDLDQFRKAKFGRTKSYAYGDSLGGGAKIAAQLQMKRSTAPLGGAPAMFAAGNAARSRRGGLGTVAESRDQDGEGDATEDETDIGDSPCPPPSKTMGLNIKFKKVGRAPLARAETLGPQRFAY